MTRKITLTSILCKFFNLFPGSLRKSLKMTDGDEREKGSFFEFELGAFFVKGSRRILKQI